MSNIINGYCNLTNFRKYIAPPAQTINEDSSDDEIIDGLIETASRRVDDLCGRVFYPYIELKRYDIPEDDVLWFDSDLLEVITFLNGDGSSIASTEYHLIPEAYYPKYCLRMTDVTSTIFLVDSNASCEKVLDLTAVWGFREEYSRRAWKSVGTLGAAWASATTLTATMTAGHTLDSRGGEILRIDNELFNSSNVVANTLTVLSRGDNGSTAVTHLINAPVYSWQPMREIKELTLEIARVMYRSRYGENVDVVSTYTPSGVIVTPRSLPVWAQEIIRKYQRIV